MTCTKTMATKDHGQLINLVKQDENVIVFRKSARLVSLNVKYLPKEVTLPPKPRALSIHTENPEILVGKSKW